MLVLRDLTLRGFRSFTRKQSLDLSGAGLIYVAGENAVEPALGPNGAGKSTLFEGLCWCLFGKTSLGLRAIDVAGWDGGEVEATLDFNKDGSDYTLRRTWQPVALQLLEGGVARPVSQEQVEQLVGLTFDTFLYAVFHAQFVSFFSDLAPSRQLEVYTAVLALDLWERCSDEAAKRALAHERALQSLQVDEARESGRLRERRETLERIDDDEHRWYRERLQEARELHRERRAAQQEAAEASAKVEALPEPLDLHDLELRAMETRGSMIKTQGKMEANRQREQQLMRPDKLPPVCPLCRQKVDRALVKQHAAEELRQVKVEADELAWQIAQVVKLNNEAEAALAAAREKVQERSALQGVVGIHTETAKRLRQELRRLAQRECPFDSTREQRACDELQEQVASLHEEVVRMERTVAGYRYWVQAFRELRLSLIRSSLAQFEVSTNNALALLGLDGWAIEYDVEGETKGGKLKRGFSILVRSPYNDSVVPFATWSGGEGQRLRLAIAAGLSDLIQDFAGNGCNLEIFDEPTAHLSEDGIADLLTMLEDRAKARDSAIWLADHHVLDYGGFRRIVTVEKTERGSLIK